MTNEEKEFEYKDALIKSEKWNRFSNLIKALGTVIISITILLAITIPQSAFNKSSTQEILKRERVKLTLEVLKEKDPNLRNQLLNLLRDIYPEINADFVNIEKEVHQQAINECRLRIQKFQTELNNCKNCNELERRNIQTNLDMSKLQLKKLEKDFSKYAKE